MAELKIHSGLTGFRLLDRISQVMEQGIQGEKNFEGSPSYLGIEAMAQLAALHVRYLSNFEKHAFLLKVGTCFLPKTDLLEGLWRFEGELLNQSSQAFTYQIMATSEDQLYFQGEFLIATIPYDGSFQQELLQQHYRRLFSCLCNDSKAD